MVDKSTVMGWLEGLTQDYWPQWYSDAEVQETAKAALVLLKEREPKPPVVKENSYGRKFYYCPSCGKDFYQNKFSFCEKCGQAVKWE